MNRLIKKMRHFKESGFAFALGAFLVLGVFVYALYSSAAWTNPTSAPIGGNVTVPLYTGTSTAPITQTRYGTLKLGTSTVASNLFVYNGVVSIATTSFNTALLAVDNFTGPAINASNGYVIGVHDPALAQDAVNKAWADSRYTLVSANFWRDAGNNDINNNNTGNVAVGWGGSPTRKLDVNGGIEFGALDGSAGGLYHDNAANTPMEFFQTRASYGDYYFRGPSGGYPARIYLTRNDGSAVAALNEGGGWGNSYVMSDFGIGTSSPNATLHLYSANPQLNIERSNVGWGYLNFINPGNLADTRIGKMTFYENNTAAAQVAFSGIEGGSAVVTAGSETGKLSFMTRNAAAYNEAMTIEAGFVGIGSTDPATMLDVVSTGGHAIRSKAANSNFAGLFYSANGNQMALLGSDLSPLDVRAGGTQGTLFVTPTGNVGIGTTSPSARLEIQSPNVLVDGPASQIAVYSSDSAAINRGGQVIFGGSDGGLSQTTWASISGRKENATSGQYSGYLSFATRVFPGSTAEKMRITSAGNVGIGTNNPLANLHINNATSPAYAKLRLSGTARGGEVDFYNGATAEAGIWTDYVTPFGLVFGTGAGLTEQMRVTAAGFVGIGTAAPNRKLHVEIPANGLALRIGIGGTDAIGMGSEGAAGNSLITFQGTNFFMGGNTGRGLAIGSGVVATDVPPTGTNMNLKGNVGIGTNSPVSKLTLAGTIDASAALKIIGSGPQGIELRSSDNTAQYIDFAPISTSDSGFGTPDSPGRIIYNSVADSLQLLAGGNGITIKTGGNVGIGTTNPSYTLDVRGQAAFGASGAENIIHFVDYPVVSYDAANKGYVDIKVAAATSTYGLWKGIGNDIYNTNIGNVGIGLNNPATMLQIGNSAVGSGVYSTMLSIGVDGARHGIMAKNDSATDKGLAFFTSIGGGAAPLERVRVNENGLGIGTINPQELLELSSTGDAGIVFVDRGNQNFGIGIPDGANYLGFFQGPNINGTAGMVLQATTGNVGIGTTNPLLALHIHRSAPATGSIIKLTNLNSGAAAGDGLHIGIDANAVAYFQNQENTDMYFLTNGLERVRILAGGKVGIGDQGPLNALTVNGGIYAANQDGGLSIVGLNGQETRWEAYYNIRSDSGGVPRVALGFKTRNASEIITSQYENLSLLNNGNVGIGTITPNNKLTIANNNISNVAIDLRSDDAVPGSQDFSLARILGTHTTTAYSGARLDLQTATGENTWTTGFSLINNRVGVATTTPQYALDVDGVGSFGSLGHENLVHNVDYPGPSIYDVANKGYVDGQISTLAGFWADRGSNNISNTNTGNVGIGTTNPNDTLDVRLQGGVNQSGLTISAPNNSGAGSQPALVFKRYNAGALYTVSNIYGEGDGGGGSIRFGTSPTAAKTTPADRMVINSEGNVGIGTTTPATKLVVGDGLSSQAITVNAGNGWADINLNSKTAAGGGGNIYWNKYGASYASILGYGNSGSPYLSFTLAGGEKVRFTNTGNVGIGTTTPAAALNVWVNQNSVTRAQVTNTNGGAAVQSGLLVTNSAAANFYMNVGLKGRGYTTAGLSERNKGEVTVGSQIDGLNIYTQKSTATILFGTGAGGIERMRIDANGYVGIATKTPAYNLDVEGVARFSSDILVGGQVFVGSGDLAEEFYTDKDYPSGTVLVMDDNGYKSARACAKRYDQNVIGVISEKPGLVIGQIDGKYKAPVALTGVIKVRINSSGGKIKKGDLLTTSAATGEAMKAAEPKLGTIIGKALEDDRGEGEIMALVNLK